LQNAIALPFQLPSGVANEQMFRFSVEAINVSQKLRGSFTYFVDVSKLGKGGSGDVVVGGEYMRDVAGFRLTVGRLKRRWIFICDWRVRPSRCRRQSTGIL
jgi:hypothetical protein